MSKSLVKKAFMLADSPIVKPKTEENVSTTKRKASALNLIPRHQKLVELVGKKGSKTERELIRRREKLTVTEAREQIANRRDHTEDNVQKLLMFSTSTLDAETRKKVNNWMIYCSIVSFP
ncbi:hypothetical protein ZHAS_00014166 [Anopheles sinensis]|uniref:40S ribosomal protein S19-binding protein 1 n=1 Tax=Anopheles sinensis TaxID=74873 RepID=A0A084W7H2_ANOSI|nr:hypothetical protein ZHAS_00014166 [Anopheles sinensis]